jgi:hypothetical protein
MTVNDNINNPRGGDGRRVRTRSMGHLPEYDPTALEEHLADIRRAARRGAAVASADGTNGDVINNNEGNENLVSRVTENPAGEALNASPIATANNNDFTFDESFGTPTSAMRRIAAVANANDEEEFTVHTFVRDSEFRSINSTFAKDIASIRSHLTRADEARHATDNTIQDIQSQIQKAEEARVADRIADRSELQQMMKDMKETMEKLSRVFATKEDMKQSSAKVEKDIKQLKEEMQTTATKLEQDMKQLTETVTSVSESNEQWMQDQMKRIDVKVKEADEAATKFYTDGVNKVAKEIKEQVHELTAKEIMDAKKKLDDFAT